MAWEVRAEHARVARASGRGSMTRPGTWAWQPCYATARTATRQAWCFYLVVNSAPGARCAPPRSTYGKQAACAALFLWARVARRRRRYGCNCHAHPREAYIIIITLVFVAQNNHRTRLRTARSASPSSLFRKISIALVFVAQNQHYTRLRRACAFRALPPRSRVAVPSVL
eukprot:6202993-Pleurochrysis_carterae.AAC.3